MPYIKQTDRIRIGMGSLPQNGGELNYKITLLLIQVFESGLSEEFEVDLRRLLDDYLKSGEEKYQRYNDITGAVYNAWLEFGRRKAPEIFEQDDIEMCDELSSTIDRVVWTFYADNTAPYEDTKILENGDVYS